MFPSLSRAALIGGLDAERRRRGLARAELQPEAKRPGLPEAEGNALEAGAYRRSVGMMRDCPRAHGGKGSTNCGPTASWERFSELHAANSRPRSRLWSTGVSRIARSAGKLVLGDGSGAIPDRLGGLWLRCNKMLPRNFLPN
jgi:hypothetical protein